VIEFLKQNKGEFLVMVVTALIALALFFVGKYAPGALEDVEMVISTLQPLVIAAIVAWATIKIAQRAGDAVEARAVADIEQAKIYAEAERIDVTVLEREVYEVIKAKVLEDWRLLNEVTDA